VSIAVGAATALVVVLLASAVLAATLLDTESDEAAPPTTSVATTASGGTTRSPGATETSPGATETAPAMTQEASLTPNGGYVVVPAGSLLASPTGNEIASFSLPRLCGDRTLVVEHVPVPGRRLRFSGKAVGQDVEIRLLGRARNAGHLSGVIRVAGKGCRSAPVRFTARLS
jgi:hypothetical protein